MKERSYPLTIYTHTGNIKLSSTPVELTYSILLIFIPCSVLSTKFSFKLRDEENNNNTNNQKHLFFQIKTQQKYFIKYSTASMFSGSVAGSAPAQLLSIFLYTEQPCFYHAAGVSLLPTPGQDTCT
jgi:hypothetical protein